MMCKEPLVEDDDAVYYVNERRWLERKEFSHTSLSLAFLDDFKRGKVDETDEFSALEETLF